MYAQAESVNITVASSLLEEDVNDWRTRLQSGESIVIDMVGLLKYNAEGKVNFEPHTTDNFLPDAFGLKTIKPNFILNTTEEEVVEKKRNWSSVLAVASIIPILVGGYFYFNTPQNVQKFVDHQWSGIVLPAIKEAAPNLLNSSTPIEKLDQKEDIIHNLPTTIVNPLEYVKAGTSISLPGEEKTDSAGINVLSRYEITVVEEKQLNEDEKEVKAIIRNSTVDAKSLNKKETAKTDTKDKSNDEVATKTDKKPEEVIKIDSNPKKFQVIAASLRRADDAARMLRFLESEGYKNSSIVYVKGRFYYVTFDSFDSMDQATKYLNKLHTQRPDAWIREHN
jgi:Sporulation related domain.